jgi:hypothetical protein
MAKRQQKVRQTPTGDWLYCSFSLHPDELEDYRRVAKEIDRSVSWWIRTVLNKEVARRKGIAGNEKPNGETQSVAVASVSADRARPDGPA